MSLLKTSTKWKPRIRKIIFDPTTFEVRCVNEGFNKVIELDKFIMLFEPELLIKGGPILSMFVIFFSLYMGDAYALHDVEVFLSKSSFKHHITRKAYKG